MPKLEYRRGDLLPCQAQVKVNAVNGLGFMGAGIALAFKEKYPQMFEDYHQNCKEGYFSNFKSHFYKDTSGDIICNLQTVDDSLKGKMTYVIRGLQELKEFMLDNKLTTVAIPPLGCGIGGLDKKEVEEFILWLFGDTDIQLYLYNF